ncbi:MAG: U32 family peptidase [Mycoplasmoidaceae bacterium]
MKIAVKCDNYAMAEKLISKGVDILYFGMKGFSCRFNNNIHLDELREIVKIKKDCQISIVLNNLYSENEIDQLEQFLIELAKINIDEICFHDYAVLQIIYEQNIKIKCHYNPETLNTNYGQFDFFRKNNIKKISLAREITLNELKQILKEKEDLEIEIQGHGFTFFMHSKWPMVSNFEKHLLEKNQKLNNMNYLVIQERKRKLPNLLYEDETGTHMFSGFILSIYQLLPDLIEAKLDSILIDNIFKDELWTLAVVDIYLIALRVIASNKFSIEGEKALAELENEFALSKSFLGNFREMPHMEKEDYEN